MALYGAIPYLIVHDDSKNGGLLWLNAAETWVDVDADLNRRFAHFMSESGVIEFFMFVGRAPQVVQRKLATVTGFVQLPPMFSLGYHQCRWNYNSQ